MMAVVAGEPELDAVAGGIARLLGALPQTELLCEW